ncbi:hypothetical protein [Demequina sp. NBRC 110053]|uniref:hypothetical protein n=1 Tax=Demequina sp. NBRC 110053 TaxID=1570342 RepID=UPI000A044D1B|nr:hypothetical protein [Demequina sp. NBRC 110053]
MTSRGTQRPAAVVRSLSAAALVAAVALAGCSSPSDPEEAVAPTVDAAAAESSTVPDETADTAPETDPAEESSPSEALEAYVQLERDQLEAMSESLDVLYSDITVTAVPPATVEYSYTFADEVDPEVFSQTQDATIETIETLVTSAVFPALEAAGVEGQKSAVYIYRNADGTEIWSHTITE